MCIRDRVVDVSVAADVESLCDNVYREMGRADVLCNNAGIGIAGRFEDVSLGDWEWALGVNLRGVLHGCHFFYPRMIAQGGGGHIVNTASGAGLAPLPLMTAYCCSKYAVVGFSETLRAEAAPHGIGVSAICPGVVDTPITRSAKLCSRTERSTPGELQKRIARIYACLLYTSDAADDLLCVDLGGRRFFKKKKQHPRLNQCMNPFVYLCCTLGASLLSVIDA